MNEIFRFIQKRDERTHARTDGRTEGILQSADQGLRPQVGDNKLTLGPSKYSSIDGLILCKVLRLVLH